MTSNHRPRDRVNGQPSRKLTVTVRQGNRRLRLTGYCTCENADFTQHNAGCFASTESINVAFAR